MSKRNDDLNVARRADTGDYSATKAPENRPHVESQVGAAPAQRPGGLFGTPSDVGMSALDRHTVPKLAAQEMADATEAAKAQRRDEADEPDEADAGAGSRQPSRRRT